MNQQLTKEAIRDLLQKHDALLTSYKVRRIGLFGSYARGEQTAESDVDLLVEFGKGVTLFEIIELERTLSEVLGKPVSIVSRNGLSRHIGPAILREVERIEKR